MSLKYKLDSLEGLDESVAALYEKSGEKYILKVEGLDKPDDVAGLKSQVETLLAEKKAEKERADKAEKDLESAKSKKAEDEGDIEAVKASWQTKYDKLESDKNAEITSLTQALETNTIQSEALKLATTLAVPKSADVLLPHIKGRLKMELRDGKAQTIVLDKDGKPSALTVEELGKEIAGDERFAPVIVGSNASGGGANGSGGGAVKGKTATRTEFDAMSQQDRSTFAKEGGKVVND